MVKFIVTGQSLEDIANAIRSKTGTSDLLTYPDDFINIISDREMFEEKETSVTTPPQAKTIDPGAIVFFGQLEVPIHTKAIKRVSPTTGYNPTYFQHYYNLTINNSTGEITGINFGLYNKSNKQQTVNQNSITVKIVSYK